MKNILVTGANGFVGLHLVRELHDQNYTLIGVGGAIGSTNTPQYLTDYLVIDLIDKEAVQKIDFRNIDAIVHLAGLAAVGPSFEEPMKYINTNIGIQTNLFEAAIEQGANPKFLIISSGTLYDSTSPLPLSESSNIIPSSPYAVSKIGQEQMAMYYILRGFSCIIARPFNHIGPGQNPGFLVPDVAQQLVAVEKGDASAVKVGNLDAKRDYTDVRDIVKAYRLLLENGQSGEVYNICTGAAISGHDIVSGLIRSSGIKAETIKDFDKLRPSDNPIVYGSNTKITEATGWKPEITLEQTFLDVINDWRSRT